MLHLCALEDEEGHCTFYNEALIALRREARGGFFDTLKPDPHHFLLGVSKSFHRICGGVPVCGESGAFLVLAGAASLARAMHMPGGGERAEVGICAVVGANVEEIGGGEGGGESVEEIARLTGDKGGGFAANKGTVNNRDRFALKVHTPDALDIGGCDSLNGIGAFVCLGSDVGSSGKFCDEARHCELLVSSFV